MKLLLLALLVFVPLILLLARFRRGQGRNARDSGGGNDSYGSSADSNCSSSDGGSCGDGGGGGD